MIEENSPLAYCKIVEIYPAIKDSYCVDFKVFSKNDTITDGQEEFVVLNEPICWKPQCCDPCYAFTVNKPIPHPVGKRLYKLNR